MNNLISPLQRQALIEGEKRHYAFRPVHELDYKEGWVYERVKEAPEIASERIKTLEAAGIKICEVYVFHEAPRVLPAPKVDPVRRDFKIAKPSIPNVGLQQALRVVVTAFSFLALMPLVMLAPLLLLDPACVVKLEDGSFVEVVRWYS